MANASKTNEDMASVLGAKERLRLALIERLAALKEDDPGARLQIGGGVYWLEDGRIRFEAVGR